MYSHIPQIISTIALRLVSPAEKDICKRVVLSIHNYYILTINDM